MNGALAVASQGERVGHVAAAILPKVEGVFPLVRMFWIAVRYDHLRQRQTPKDRSNSTVVVEGDVRQDETLAIWGRLGQLAYSQTNSLTHS